MRDEVQLGELAVADLVLDLARLQVTLVVGDRALQVREGPQGGEGETGREHEGLQRDDERVPPEQGHEPGHAGRRHPSVPLVHWQRAG